MIFPPNYASKAAARAGTLRPKVDHLPDYPIRKEGDSVRHFDVRGAAVLILVLASAPVLADAFAARVNIVTDGATITVTDARSRQQRQVRLLGVDAPARASPLGNASRTALSALLFERNVRVEPSGQDGKHIVGKVVVLADPRCDGLRCPGIDAGMQQIRTGMAAWNRRDAAAQTPEDQNSYQQAEFAAQIRRLGIWADSRRRERP